MTSSSTAAPHEPHTKTCTPHHPTNAEALISAATEAMHTDAPRALLLARAARRAARHHPNTDLPARAALRVGESLIWLSRFPEALAACNAALEAARATGNRALEGHALVLLGNIHLDQARYVDAAEHYLAALPISTEMHDLTMRRSCVGNLGAVYFELGDFNTSITQYAQALDVCEQLNDVGGQSVCRTNIAKACGELGKYPDALTHLHAGLTQAHASGNAHYLAYALSCMGRVHLALGNLPDADGWYRQLLHLTRTHADQRHELQALLGLGQVGSRAGHHPEALGHLTAAASLASRLSDARYEAKALRCAGEVLLQQDRTTDAREQLLTALSLAERTGSQDEAAATHRTLAELYERTGDPARALRHFRTYHDLEIQVRHRQANLHTQVLLVQHDVDRAQRDAEHARARTAELALALDELAAAHQSLTEADAQRTRLLGQLAHQATHDSLTGLPNRAEFDRQLTSAVHAALTREQPMAVLFVDLDRFKLVNDTHGHQTGDLLLSEIARRLRHATPPGATIARLGGDEFTVILPDPTGAPEASRVARDIVLALRAPFSTGGRTITVSGSVGIAMCPADGRTPSTLKRHADAAMYHAKHRGKNGVVRYRRGLTVR